MTPESIPEDREQSFPCACGGNVVLFEGVWQCDSCSVTYTQVKEITLL